MRRAPVDLTDILGCRVGSKVRSGESILCPLDRACDTVMTGGPSDSPRRRRGQIRSNCTLLASIENDL